MRTRGWCRTAVMLSNELEDKKSVSPDSRTCWKLEMEQGISGAGPIFDLVSHFSARFTLAFGNL